MKALSPQHRGHKCCIIPATDEFFGLSPDGVALKPFPCSRIPKRCSLWCCVRLWVHYLQVRLVVGPASRAALREAGASGARMVVVRAGKSFPEQEASDADTESIGQLVEVPMIPGVFSRYLVCIVVEPFIDTNLRQPTNAHGHTATAI